MIDRLLAIIAPHHCFLCGKAGSSVCTSCEYDITKDSPGTCIMCGSLLVNQQCSHCRLPFQKQWFVVPYEDVEVLVLSMKTQPNRETAGRIGEMIGACVGSKLPMDMAIVPIPTIAKHIRQRGFDHTLLIARALARRFTRTPQLLLERKTSTVQVGANRATRLKQAAHAFRLASGAKVPKRCLLIDDVSTTGATMREAARCLRDNGAEEVWVAVFCHGDSTNR